MPVVFSTGLAPERGGASDSSSVGYTFHPGDIIMRVDPDFAEKRGPSRPSASSCQLLGRPWRQPFPAALEHWIDFLLLAKQRRVMIDRRTKRILTWKDSPGATSSKDVKDAIEYFTHIYLSWSSSWLACWDERLKNGHS